MTTLIAAPVDAAAELVTTPRLMLSPRAITRSYRALRAALGDVTLYYAVKANPHPAVLAAIAEAGGCFDVASPAETDAVLATGADASRLLSSNPMQSRPAIRHHHAAGIDTFVVDSLDEAHKVAAEAPGATLLARLATSGAGSDWSLAGKFGADPAEVFAILDLAPQLGLQAAGVAFHVGSQQREPERWIAPIDTAAGIFTALREHGHRPWLLDLGGGFPASHAVPCPPLAVYGRTIEAAVQAAFGAHRPRLIAEPGRALVGDAGVLEASVLGVAHRAGRRWVYLDAGIFNGLTETLGEAIHYRLRTSATGAPAAAVLAGPTCDSADVMYRCVDLPDDLAEGDRVWFAAAGVYTTSYASAFNGFAPLRTELTDTLPCVG